jgi:dimethylhistidine N-methyltransferase
MSKRQRALAYPSATTAGRTTIVRLVEPLDSQSHVKAFAEAVRSGLTRERKTLPWTYLYDEEGSRLFEQICELPEYYLTRTEDEILRHHADEMVGGLVKDDDDAEPETLTIIELGSGSAVKTQRLLTAGLRRYGGLHYVPIDVSPSALEDSTRRLNSRFPRLRVTGYVADYRRGLERLMSRARGPRLVVFLGSSLGNYETVAAANLLKMIASTMRSDDRLLLGTDLAKSRPTLEAAYDDAAGVTAAFNLNLLRRINRELGANFDLEAFGHRATYREDLGRVELYLVSRRQQSVAIPAADLTVPFAEGELIHTENSHKYTPAMLDDLRMRAGFFEEASWSDSDRRFRVQRWRLSESGQE